MDFNISTGKISGAVKTVIYGVEGIGKSTLAAKFPNPLYIDTEGSTKRLDVARLPAPTSWEMLLQELDFVRLKHPCDTIIIDTVDWAEQLCIADLCARNNKSGIEDFSYGKGWEYEKESFGKLLNKLSEVIAAGINVVLVAHAVLRKFEQPDEMGSYDRWELKLGNKTTNKIAPLIKEWADMVLFCNYKTLVVATDKDGKKHKATGNKRVMYSTYHPCWDAKNRFDLADEIPMDYEQIRFIFEGAPAAKAPAPAYVQPAPVPAMLETMEQIKTENSEIPQTATVPQALADLMRASGISEAQIRKACALKGYFPEEMPISAYPADFINGVLIAAWGQIVDFINAQYPF